MNISTAIHNKFATGCSAPSKVISRKLIHKKPLPKQIPVLQKTVSAQDRGFIIYPTLIQKKANLRFRRHGRSGK